MSAFTTQSGFAKMLGKATVGPWIAVGAVHFPLWQIGDSMNSEQLPAAIDADNSGPQAASMIQPAWRWGLCLFVAAAAAWALLNFNPIQFELPKELLSVDAYSPPELQEAKAEQTKLVHWQNTLTRLGFVGLCLGGVALLAAVGRGSVRDWVGGVVAVLVGVACGVLAGHLGILLRRYLNTNVPIPLVGENSRLLATDIGVLVLASVILAVPVSLAVMLGSGAHRIQKAVAILLAGVVAGLLGPLAMYLALPNSQTCVFPPQGLGPTAIWLAVLAALIFVFTTLTGSRRASVQPNRAADLPGC